MKGYVFRKGFHQCIVGSVDVFRISRKGDPAERSLAFTKQRADIRRDEPGKRKRIPLSSFQGKFAQVISVIKHYAPASLKFKHKMNMTGHTLQRQPLIFSGIAVSELHCLWKAQAIG